MLLRRTCPRKVISDRSRTCTAPCARVTWCYVGALIHIWCLLHAHGVQVCHCPQQCDVPSQNNLNMPVAHVVFMNMTSKTAYWTEWSWLLHCNGRHFQHFDTELGLRTALPKQWTPSIHRSIAAVAVTHCTTRSPTLFPPLLLRTLPEVRIYNYFKSTINPVRRSFLTKLQNKLKK